MKRTSKPAVSRPYFAPGAVEHWPRPSRLARFDAWMTRQPAWVALALAAGLVGLCAALAWGVMP